MHVATTAFLALLLLVSFNARTAGAAGKEKQGDGKAAAAEDDGPAGKELEKPAAELSFEDTPAREAIKALHQSSTTNFFLDAAALKSAGLDSDARVTVEKGGDATLGSVLSKILSQLGEGKDGARAGFETAGNLVIVSTAERAKTLAKEQGELARRGGNQFERAALKRVLPEATFEGVALSDVLQFIQDLTSTRMQPDWKELAAAGVEREARVSLSVRDLTVAQAMHLILAAVGPTEPLDFSMRGGNQMIVTRRAVLEEEGL